MSPVMRFDMVKGMREKTRKRFGNNFHPRVSTLPAGSVEVRLFPNLLPRSNTPPPPIHPTLSPRTHSSLSLAHMPRERHRRARTRKLDFTGSILRSISIVNVGKIIQKIDLPIERLLSPVPRRWLGDYFSDW